MPQAESITDWISAVSAAVAAFGVVILAAQIHFAKRQIELSRRQMVDDHDRSRRKCAIDLMVEWSTFVREQGTAAKAIAETLDAERANLLWATKAFRLPERYKRFVEHYLERRGTPCVLAVEGDQVQIETEHCHELRRGMVAYLNLLESILAARRHNVADRDMLKEQFKDLIVPEKNKTIMSELRRAAGGPSTFPSIEAFVVEITREKMTPAPGKGVLGDEPLCPV